MIKIHSKIVAGNHVVQFENPEFIGHTGHMSGHITLNPTTRRIEVGDHCTLDFVVVKMLAEYMKGKDLI
jgi:hypothetical protein